MKNSDIFQSILRDVNMEESGASTKQDTLDVTFVRDKWIHLILRNELIDKWPDFFDAFSAMFGEWVSRGGILHASTFLQLAASVVDTSIHSLWTEYRTSRAPKLICTLSTELGLTCWFLLPGRFSYIFRTICVLATNWCYFVTGGKPSVECVGWIPQWIGQTG